MRKPKHPHPELELGLYQAYNSQLAFAVRTGTKLVYYIALDYPMRLQHASFDTFMRMYPKYCQQYTPEEAARRFLFTQQAEQATNDARAALEHACGYDLLDTTSILD